MWPLSQRNRTRSRWHSRRPIRCRLSGKRRVRQAVEGCAWSPDARWIATGGHDDTVRVLSTVDGTELCQLTGHQG
ncbi:hypothetical protein [Streptomyces sp. MA25(2023)]